MSAEGREIGPFRLLERIDLGGMAEVYRAVVLRADGDRAERALALEQFGAALAPGAHVALKRLLPFSAADDELLRLFEAEVRTAAAQHHPSLCPVHAWGWDGDTPFLVMKLIEGPSWHTVLADVERAGRQLPVEVVASLGVQLADALSALHADTGEREPGVVHRDVSPHNAMVDATGRVYLIDFGIATARGQARQTQHGVVKGKVGYLAPEQLGRQRLDGRTDLFALGVILWESLAGRRLFGGGAFPEVVERIRQAQVPPLAEVGRAVPAALEQAIRRALEPSPADRFPNAAALRDALVAAVPAVADDPLRVMARWLRAAPPGEVAHAPSVEARFARSAEGLARDTTDRHASALEHATRVVDLEALAARAATSRRRRAPPSSRIGDLAWLLGVGIAAALMLRWWLWLR